MTLYNCPDCRRWHSGSGHVCTDPLPDLRDQRTLERAVVKVARAATKAPALPNLDALRQALRELDGQDRPLKEGE